MSDRGWNTGDTALIVAIVLFFAMLVIVGSSHNEQRWWILDLQKRTGTLEQRCP